MPLNDKVYEYLDRMNIKGTIQLDSEKKPFSRIYISNKLISIREKVGQLNEVDSDLLQWYESEFAYEIIQVKKRERKYSEGESNSRIKERWRLLDYGDSLFSFKLSPILGGNVTLRGSENNYAGWIGLRTWITGSDWFGGMLDMRNVGEFGDFVDNERTLTPERGFDLGTPHDNGVEWSDVRVQLNLNWDWGSVSLKKDYNEWGNSYFGNLIISDKAPSYPHLTFEIKPVEWFRFYYKFGWIHSGVIDSARSIIVNPGEEFEVAHQRFVKKYFVANMLTFSPFNWGDISIGNSFIYAGDFRAEMMIPFNFYKYMDRNTGKKEFEDGNGAFFLDIAIRLPNKYKFYSTLFFDVDSKEGSLGTFLNKAWYAFTLGGKRVDLVFDNLDLTVEYSRIKPWVYEHKYESLGNYKHLDYSLGHWIGQNSDQLKFQLNYQPISRLRLTLWAEYIRKGGEKDISYAYLEEEEVAFLYSPLRKDKYLGLKVSYELIHELFFEGSFTISSIRDDDENRTHEYLIGKYESISLSAFYGIR